jgi:hypothetical protein
VAIGCDSGGAIVSLTLVTLPADDAAEGADQAAEGTNQPAEGAD